MLPQSVLSLIASFTDDERLKDYLSLGCLPFVGSAHSISLEHLSKLIPDFNRAQLINFIQSFHSTHDPFLIDKHIRLSDDILTRTDLATMMASIECRVPFLSTELIAFSNQLPIWRKIGFLGFSNKNLLKRLALQLGVPRVCIERPKIGFELPIKEWLSGPSGPLNHLVQRYIRLQRVEALDYEYLASLASTLTSPTSPRLSTSILWHWLTYELVLDSIQYG